jgi:adenylosuccinate lyase
MSDEDVFRIKELERTTNHDVKAVEYFLKEKFDLLGLSAYKEFIHFGLTSQDINNTAIPASFRDPIEEVYIPAVDRILERLVNGKMCPCWRVLMVNPLLQPNWGKSFMYSLIDWMNS